MNLIICVTNLQLLIAERIMDSHPNEEFFLLGVPLETDKKFDYYFTRVSNKANQKKYLKYNNKVQLVFILFAIKINSFFRNWKVKDIYLASIEHAVCHLLIGIFRKNISSLQTFDDGTANIVKSSTYYTKKDSIIIKILRFFLYRGISNKTLINLSSIHYTIYKNYSNIIENTKYISLLPDNIKTIVPKKTIKIMLGQPIFHSHKLSNKKIPDKNVDFFQKALIHSGSTYYLPHPREIFYIKGVTYIETSMIAEDYIVNQVIKNPDIKYVLYSCFSSALLNVKNIPNVECIALTNDEISEKGKESYQFFENFGISIESVE